MIQPWDVVVIYLAGIPMLVIRIKIMICKRHSLQNHFILEFCWLILKVHISTFKTTQATTQLTTSHMKVTISRLHMVIWILQFEVKHLSLYFYKYKFWGSTAVAQRSAHWWGLIHNKLYQTMEFHLQIIILQLEWIIPVIFS